MTEEQESISPQKGPQEQFVSCSADVIFYGGAAGGGKSFALLLDTLYDVDNNKFGAVIFRRTTKQITNEGGLWDEASGLFTRLGASLNQTSLSATFPSGSCVSFAHMEHEKNRHDWQGSQIAMIGFDELTHFTWVQFNYMLSRNRSVSGAHCRIRATCNPDPDHWVRKFIDWYIDKDGFPVAEKSGVIRYFVVAGDDVVWADTAAELSGQFPQLMPKSFTFITSKVYDNKILLKKNPQYLSNLHALTRVEKARLLDGNWNIRITAGSYFRRSDFMIVDVLPIVKKTVRGWDLAATEVRAQQEMKKKNATDPDWTVGVRMSTAEDGIYYIDHVERFREDPPKIPTKIKAIAIQDKVKTKIRMPQDPGQAGKAQKFSYAKLLSGFNLTFVQPTGDKETRAIPFAAQVQAGCVKLVRGPWNEDFIKELESFPKGGHDDQVDAAADAFDELLEKKRIGTW